MLIRIELNRDDGFVLIGFLLFAVLVQLEKHYRVSFLRIPFA